MLVAAISSEEYMEPLKNAVQVVGGQLAFKQVVQEADDLKKAFSEIKRSYVDVIVIDAGCLGAEHIYQEVQNYRLVKEKTRIVIVSPGASPGDTLLVRPAWAQSNG